MICVCHCFMCFCDCLMTDKVSKPWNTIKDWYLWRIETGPRVLYQVIALLCIHLWTSLFFGCPQVASSPRRFGNDLQDALSPTSINLHCSLWCWLDPIFLGLHGHGHFSILGCASQLWLVAFQRSTEFTSNIQYNVCASYI